jgi:hypothetical protein
MLSPWIVAAIVIIHNSMLSTLFLKSLTACSFSKEYFRSIVNLKNAVFWDVVHCRSCVNRRFVGTYRLHLQGRKIRERRTSPVCSHLLTLVPRSRIFLPWRWRQDLHCATSQKTAFFIVTAVKTSDLTSETYSFPYFQTRKTATHVAYIRK